MVLYIASGLLVLLGAAHSFLGERFLLQPLFARGRLPIVLGDTSFARGTLRFAWHITTLCGWAGAYLLYRMEAGGVLLAGDDLLTSCMVVCLLSALMAAGFTRGRHLSWVVFLAIAGLAWFARKETMV